MRAELSCGARGGAGRAAAGAGAGAPGGVAAHLARLAGDDPRAAGEAAAGARRSGATSSRRQLADGEAPLAALAGAARAARCACARRSRRSCTRHASRARSSMPCCGSATSRRAALDERVEAARARTGRGAPGRAAGARAARERRRAAGGHHFRAGRRSSPGSRRRRPARDLGGAAWRRPRARSSASGQVNLAAIGEFKEQSERKEYLDRQCKDLTDALETLESAMRKIDRETRTRFQDTFDRVNAGLKEKFPRLFGGGHAYLELDGRGVGGRRRLRDGAAAGQAQQHHQSAVGRREGADRGRAGVRDLRSESGAVLPAGRGRCAARRQQHRPLLRHRARDVAQRAVHFHHAQQDHHGNGLAIGRRDA